MKFFERVKRAKKQDMLEELDLGGWQPTTPKDAIDEDWIGVIMNGVAGITDAMRLTQPDAECERKRMMRRNMAIVVAAIEEWEKKL